MDINNIYDFVKRINPEITKEELIRKMCENEIFALSLSMIAEKDFSSEI